MTEPLRTLHQLQIPPSPKLHPHPPQPLSFIDSIWLPLPPFERLFFFNFPHSAAHFSDRHLPSLTSSLSFTLHHFHPLSASLRRSLTLQDQFEIFYSEGDSVSLTVAEVAAGGGDFAYISDYQPRELKKLRPLLPKLERTADGPWPLLALQVTLFPQKGICIGMAVHHAVCDGSGFKQFVKSWAAACRSAAPEIEWPPFLDRSVLVDSRRHGSRILQITRQIAEKDSESSSSPVPNHQPLLCSTFTLSPSHILKLKDQIQSNLIEQSKPSFHCSSFVVTCAYIWLCLIKAQKLSDDLASHLSFAVDWRSRMRPPLPANYFGNCLGFGVVELKAAGRFAAAAAAEAIGKEIDRLKTVEIGETIDEVLDLYFKLGHNKPYAVVGSPRFRVYETDFGWGKPEKVDVVFAGNERSLALAESREEEGGIEVGLCLAEDEMTEFSALFASGLETLLAADNVNGQ